LEFKCGLLVSHRQRCGIKISCSPRRLPYCRFVAPTNFLNISCYMQN